MKIVVCGKILGPILKKEIFSHKCQWQLDLWSKYWTSCHRPFNLICADLCVVTILKKKTAIKWVSSKCVFFPDLISTYCKEVSVISSKFQVVSKIANFQAHIFIDQSVWMYRHPGRPRMFTAFGGAPAFHPAECIINTLSQRPPHKEYVIFKESALWADSFSKSKCLCVCLPLGKSNGKNWSQI